MTFFRFPCGPTEERNEGGPSQTLRDGEFSFSLLRVRFPFIILRPLEQVFAEAVHSPLRLRLGLAGLWLADGSEWPLLEAPSAFRSFWTLLTFG